MIQNVGQDDNVEVVRHTGRRQITDVAPEERHVAVKVADIADPPVPDGFPPCGLGGVKPEMGKQLSPYGFHQERRAA